ncbi:hypothetical protein GCM10020001_038720 [Nonomuraea salmonea]
MRGLLTRQRSAGLARDGGDEESVSGGVALAGVLPFADDEDGVFVGQGQLSMVYSEPSPAPTTIRTLSRGVCGELDSSRVARVRP